MDQQDGPEHSHGELRKDEPGALPEAKVMALSGWALDRRGIGARPGPVRDETEDLHLGRKARVEERVVPVGRLECRSLGRKLLCAAGKPVALAELFEGENAVVAAGKLCRQLGVGAEYGGQAIVESRRILKVR